MAKRSAPSFTFDSSHESPLHSSGPSTTSSSTPASSRITRSAARLAAAATSTTPSQATPVNPPEPPPASRKRKAIRTEDSPGDPGEPAVTGSVRRSKRQRIEEPEPLPASTPQTLRRQGKQPIMSAPESPEPPTENENSMQPTSSKRKSSRTKKPNQETPPPPAQTSGRRAKKNVKKVDETPDQVISQPSSSKSSRRKPKREPSEEEEEDRHRVRDDADEDDDGDDGDDPFGSSFLGRGGAASLHSTMRALSGMMGGSSTGSRLREILENLRQKDDPSVQIIALGELAQLLLVSTEDNLSGQIAPDQFVKELVVLMQPNEFGEENSEMMLLACRCIANLMEALPPATASVVYGGAVPILCQKLLEIHYIDLAEQALSTLEKISVEFPASIVREGGLTACLTYLDFFATSTQRTAVTTAANCCRNIPEDSFPVVRDVMPILLNVLSSNDQKVVEQGSLCVSRVVESFKYQQPKLEELVSADLLKAVLRLLLPGTTNLIGPNIHTQFLRVLSITSRASPSLATDLLKMDVVDTLYQILTGVSPPADTEDIAAKIDGVIIMQALIHRPREQIYESLNVICELLPGLSPEGLSMSSPSLDISNPVDDYIHASNPKPKKSANTMRVELLKTCQDKVKRFVTILLPTLTHAYSSTVNLSVRQKVLMAQLKMLSNIDTSILESALRAVPFASYLASILSQQDHPSLVIAALQAAELLLVRLKSIYGYQFCREGVMAEIEHLASQPLNSTEKKKNAKPELDAEVTAVDKEANGENSGETSGSEDDDDADDAEDDDGDGEDGEDEDEDDADRVNLHGSSPSTSTSSSEEGSYDGSSLAPPLKDYVTRRAKRFLDVHQDSESVKMREKANEILDKIRSLATSIKDHYYGDHVEDGRQLFASLAKFFSPDALESMTSAELLISNIIDVLLEIFDNPDIDMGNEAKSTFLEVFVGTITQQQHPASGALVGSPFSVLVHKLQDLLSRAEHFEVVTVHHSSLDSNRSSAASMLAKQLRLKLVADDNSEIPRPYRNIMVSIHAIATFKALDDYLRPRISLSERPRGGRHHEGLSGTLAAFAAAAGMPNPHQRLVESGLLGMTEHSPIPSPSAPASRKTAKKLTKEKPSAPVANPETQKPVEDTKSTPPRRSTRHRQASARPPPPPAQPSDPPQDSLECADERQLSDEDNMEDSSALDAFVEDLDEEMEGAPLPDPSAVSLEVASTGKVTARQEDGTRVPTPSHNTTTSTPQAPPAPSIRGIKSPTNTARAMSYAAAIQSVPQDWHIEFSIDDQAISKETTIYRAVHYNRHQPDSLASRNVWSAVHSIKFKRVPGPPAPEPSSLTPSPDPTTSTADVSLPVSLHTHQTTSKILRLLNSLHELNANLDDVLDDSNVNVKIRAEPVGQFVNTKLTAKLNRQLEEPLIVASSCLPTWSEDLARLYPFLFPFETRHLFLQSTSFGYSRSMTRWQNSQSAEESRRDRHRDDRPFLGRLQRQKVRISRARILESAVKVMELYGSSPSVLEVEYFEEVGTGLGPTLEFYSSVSKEYSKKRIKFWRENESNPNDDHAFGKSGLFPAPMSPQQATSENGKRILHLFKMLGKFVARSMLDSRIIDISLNPMFFKIGDRVGKATPSLAAIKAIDSDLASSLKLIKQFVLAKKKVDESPRLSPAQKVNALQRLQIQGAAVQDLGLDFTLPGYPAIELIENGSNIPVTLDNISTYLDKVIDFTLGSGVERQINEFRAGFSQVFPYSAMKAFTPAELVMLFGRVEEDWTIETLMDSIKADHGFNMDSKSIRNLLQTMSELDPSQRRDFLQFVTGSPKLPIGGFKSLTPMFTVVCKPSEPPYTSDDYLPSVMTCVNYLKLPDYTDLNIMRRQLNTAIQEGQGAFHLS